LNIGGEAPKQQFKQLIPQGNIKANSNIAIPNFSDGTVNGKGYSFNPVPKERFDNAQRPELFKSGA